MECTTLFSQTTGISLVRAGLYSFVIVAIDNRAIVNIANKTPDIIIKPAQSITGSLYFGTLGLIYSLGGSYGFFCIMLSTPTTAW